MNFRVFMKLFTEWFYYKCTENFQFGTFNILQFAAKKKVYIPLFTEWITSKKDINNFGIKKLVEYHEMLGGNGRHTKAENENFIKLNWNCFEIFCISLQRYTHTVEIFGKSVAFLRKKKHQKIQLFK